MLFDHRENCGRADSDFSLFWLGLKMANFTRAVNWSTTSVIQKRLLTGVYNNNTFNPNCWRRVLVFEFPTPWFLCSNRSSRSSEEVPGGLCHSLSVVLSNTAWAQTVLINKLSENAFSTVTKIRPRKSMTQLDTGCYFLQSSCYGESTLWPFPHSPPSSIFDSSII